MNFGVNCKVRVCTLSNSIWIPITCSYFWRSQGIVAPFRFDFPKCNGFSWTPGESSASIEPTVLHPAPPPPLEGAPAGLLDPSVRSRSARLSLCAHWCSKSSGPAVQASRLPEDMRLRPMCQEPGTLRTHCGGFGRTWDPVHSDGNRFPQDWLWRLQDDLGPRPQGQDICLLRTHSGGFGRTWGHVHKEKNRVSSGFATGGAGEEKAKPQEEELPERGR